MENSALLSSKSPILAGSSDPSRILSRRWRAFPTLRGVGVTRRQICLASAIKGGRNDGAPQKNSNNAFVDVSSQEVLQKDSEYSVDSGEPLLDSVKWDEKGLAVAIAQDVDTGAILMQGFANREALATTISSRKVTFYSRSRASLWTKGETSMNFINVEDIFLDCDRDSIIYLGKPDGPTCHTGAEACYYTSVADLSEDPQVCKFLNSFILSQVLFVIYCFCLACYENYSGISLTDIMPMVAREAFFLIASSNGAFVTDQEGVLGIHYALFTGGYYFPT